MAGAREVYSTFSVTSGHLCFGALHNIWEGALEPPVQGLPYLRAAVGGTVKAHPLKYNVPAERGKWSAFQLVDLYSPGNAGWFVCHSSVDPAQEIDKLLRVSGSPYDLEGGSSMNNDRTRAEGVLVINRYDWDYYQGNYLEEIGDDYEDIELSAANSAGVVDYSRARTQVQKWKQQSPPRTREPSRAGVWMHNDGEYMYGRFGYNDARTAARSFILFSSNTVFTSTTFAGLQQPFRKEETDEERFERQLREGFDFSGVAWLREIEEVFVDYDPSKEYLYPRPPPESERLGPYDRSEHILEAQDIDALRYLGVPPPPKVIKSHRARGVDLRPMLQSRSINLGFAEQWEEPVYDLLNEMVLSYLDRFVLPHISIDTPSEAAEALFPRHAEAPAPRHPEQTKTFPPLDSFFYSFFMHPRELLTPKFDIDAVGNKIGNFLISHAGTNRVLFNKECFDGLAAVISFMIFDLLDQANLCARDCHHSNIVPIDVRVMMNNDDDLCSLLRYAKVYWHGRE
jgi:hypothetical protein